MKRVLLMVALVVTVKTTCCEMTYDEIREQLQEGAITLQEAQTLWLEHKSGKKEV